MAGPSGYNYQQVVNFIDAGADLTKLSEALLGPKPAIQQASSTTQKSGMFGQNKTTTYSMAGLINPNQTKEVTSLLDALTVIYRGRKADFETRTATPGMKAATTSEVVQGNSQGASFADFNYNANKSLLG